jgi:hypothetical protein
MTETLGHFGISRVSQGGKVHKDNCNPDFDDEQKAIEWCIDESKKTPERLDVMKRGSDGHWRCVKHVLNGVVSDPK